MVKRFGIETTFDFKSYFIYFDKVDYISLFVSVIFFFGSSIRFYLLAYL